MATLGDGSGAGPERAFVSVLPAEGWVTLDPAESAHLVRVRRVREGDDVVLFDGRGGSRLARLEGADPRASRLALGGAYPDRAPKRPLRVAASLPEGARADRLVAGLAELGVRSFQPVTFARTPRRRVGDPAQRLARWKRLALAAAKVNGCAHLLRVEAPTTFAELLASPCILLDTDPAAASLFTLLADWPGELPWLVVGPEGGLDATERARVREREVAAARLGRPVLRVEAAALGAAAVAGTVVG